MDICFISFICIFVITNILLAVTVRIDIQPTHHSFYCQVHVFLTPTSLLYTFLFPLSFLGFLSAYNAFFYMEFIIQSMEYKRATNKIGEESRCKFTIALKNVVGTCKNASIVKVILTWMI